MGQERLGDAARPPRQADAAAAGVPAVLARLAGCRVLVTGAAGFIGGRLRLQLIEAGAEVHGTSRWPHAPEPGTAWHVLDPTDADATTAVIELVRPEVVFHLAGVTSAARSADLVLPSFRGNVVSTVNLLSACARAGGVRRFVLAGSLETPTVDPADGTIRASSPYAASKLAAEAYARLFNDAFGLPTVVARIFMVYGPGQRDLRKLVPYVAVSLLGGREARLSSGERRVDWVYVDDVARDLAVAAVSDRTIGQTVDLGSGVLTPVRAIAQRLGQLVRPDAPLLLGAVPDRPQEQVRAADPASRRALLGELPMTPLDQGLKRTVDWYRERLESGEIDPAGL